VSNSKKLTTVLKLKDMTDLADAVFVQEEATII